MAIVNTHYEFCAKGGALNFTYTGECNVRDDGVVELLTSGTLVFLDPAVIDIFCVGGGGKGWYGESNSNTGCGGGAGGYTNTVKAVKIAANTQIPVTIGAGSTQYNVTGGTTTFGNVASAKGGNSGGAGTDTTYYTVGANGGSGGGGGASARSTGGSGGSDGGNGVTGSAYSDNGGRGQGNTTREFGDRDGKLYAGGGGGGRYISGSNPVVSAGGSGGGGAGSWVGGYQLYKNADAGKANTGGGGGGGTSYYSGNKYLQGGSGGSGICCFRAAK